MIDYKTAKQYVDFGWSVIPVILTKDEKTGKVEKKPGINSWKEYQTRKPTDEELKQWFDGLYQFNGIGLVTGQVSGLVVVDVDSLETPIDIDAGIVSKTISGGHHYFFKWTEEIRNGVRFLPNIDFRGDGGFVVIAPSSLDFVGSYQWQKVDLTKLTPLPENIKMSLDNPSKQQEEVEIDMFRPAEMGERDNRTTQLAGWLARKLPERDWENGLEMLMLWNKSNPEPLSDHDVLKCWRSVTSRERRKHEGETTGSTACKIFYGSQALDEDKRLKFEYGDGMTTGFDELDSMFKFLPQQLYLISAATHQGKTTFALNMCARIATCGVRVLFASLEQGTFIAPRVETMLAGPYPQTLSILTADDMTTVKGMVDFIESLPEKPQLICVDHLHFIKKKGNGVTQDIDEIVIELQNMAKKLEVPVIVIAHTRKLNDDRPPTLDDLRDSSSLSQVPSVVIFLHRPINKNMKNGGNYLADNGYLYVSKNRIQGRTGAKSFTLKPSGEITFDPLTPEQMESIVKSWNNDGTNGNKPYADA